MKKSLVAATAVAAVMTAWPATPASAQDAPGPGCFGYLFKDKTGDAARAHPGFTGEAAPDNLDLVEGWVDVKGGVSSVFMRVKDLDTTIPNGATAVTWQANYVGAAGTAAWVRAMTDFTGLITYDYGGMQDTPAIPFNVRAGGTTGAFTPGPNGVVQLDFPETVEPKGQQLKSFVIATSEAVQVIPGAAPTPVKGGSLYEDDSAAGKGTFTVGGGCPAEAPAPPSAADVLKPAAPAATGGGKLPVKVTATKFRARSVRKGLTLKLTSTEPLTQIGARLKKGKKVVAKGALAKLSGKGSLKLKSKKVKKGSYVLDLVGTDASGARRFTTAKIRVR